MSKFKLDSAGKKFLAEYAKPLEEFPRIYQGGERKGEFIWEVKRIKISGRKLISGGINKIDATIIEPNKNYFVEQQIKPILCKPLEFLVAWVEDRGITPEILTEAVTEFYRLFDESKKALQKLKEKQETN